MDSLMQSFGNILPTIFHSMSVSFSNSILFFVFFSVNTVRHECKIRLLIIIQEETIDLFYRAPKRSWRKRNDMLSHEDPGTQSEALCIGYPNKSRIRRRERFPLAVHPRRCHCQ